MDDRISIDPQICHGEPVIRGMSVPVTQVVGYLGGGKTIADVEKGFGLAIEDILAAVDYAAEQAAHEEPQTGHEPIAGKEPKHPIDEIDYD
jgi:uncharacterized protein (DUF433 family)